MQQQAKAKFQCKNCDLSFSSSPEVVEHFKRTHQAKSCRACGCPAGKEFCQECSKEHASQISHLTRLDEEVRKTKLQLAKLCLRQNEVLQSFVKKHPQGRISIYCEHGDVRETCARCAKIFDILDAKRDERIRQRKANEAEALLSDVKPLSRMQRAKFVHL